MLIVLCCVLFVVYCLVLGDCGSLYDACWRLLGVGRCLLCVACWLVFVGVCSVLFDN